ncbi:hypothetical protein [Pseudoalteromonas sp. MQS005]|jgi:hypothetical protein|uniref:hypothetical protein n=1 Tax=Pseudoalteromonas sp. MQS005 TaxID=1854052 RepID=UPI0007E51B5D|nr:hypothetical protein [Pseudoalteromonas sp. MQS005]
MKKKKFTVNNLPPTLSSKNLVVQEAGEVEQLKLFTDTHFEGLSTNSLSNTFPVYDLWSRFVRLKTTKYNIKDAPDKLINTRSILDKFDGLVHKGQLDISPAVIKGKESDFVAWPSDREEKVERALISLATKGNISLINATSGTSYAIHFTMKELQNELKSVKQTLSNVELKEALLILSGSQLSFNYTSTSENGDVVSNEAKMPYLGAIHFSNKKGRSSERCIVFLNEYMAQQIETVSYKGYYFNQAQQFKRTLSSWLTTRLYTMFRFASPEKTYHFMLKRIMIKFGSIESEDIQKNRLIAIRRNMTTTMQDLIEAGIIEKYDNEAAKDCNGEIVDYKYTVYPTAAFCDEILSLNKHAKKIKIKSQISAEDVEKLEVQK